MTTTINHETTKAAFKSAYVLLLTPVISQKTLSWNENQTKKRDTPSSNTIVVN